MYDLKTDPSEKNNVAVASPLIVKEIEKIMEEQHVENKDWPLFLSEMKNSSEKK